MAKILTCYYRPKPGGLCKRLFRAINALLKNGHTIHYLSVLPFPISHPYCHFHRFPWRSDKTEGYLFWAVFHLLAPVMLLFLGFKYRISHAFAFGPTYSLLLQPLHILKNIPLSLFLRADTLKNHEFKEMPGWLLMLESRLEAMAVFNVKLYPVSRNLSVNVLSRHRVLMPKHSEILINDINKTSRSNSCKKKNCPHLRLACVGILEKRKNQHMILNLIDRVDPEQAQLYIYGVGPDATLLEQLAQQKRLSRQVHFMGWVDETSLWSQVDLLLMPSLHEGVSNAILEALAYNVPVLASDIPEHREILPLNNLLSIEQPSLWIERLHKILKNSDRELTKICKQQLPHAVRLHFDWDQEICKKILDS